MSSPLKKFLRGVQKSRRYFSGRTLILLYHRIAEAESDPWQLAVSPHSFEEHLQVLTRYWRAASLGQLPGSISEALFPRRHIVMTFDDGYADNLLVAKPLLEKYDVPATVFIATGYTGQDREFWWDELEGLLMQPGDLPAVLDLTVNQIRKHWELGDFARYDEASYANNLGWRAWQEKEPTSRHSVYRSLWQLMNPMREEDRLRVRHDLLEWAGTGGNARESHRIMSSEELVQLVEGGLIDAGCHTITHPQLSALTREEQSNEIRNSKSCLEEIVGHRVTEFAYPYGRECDYTGETISIVRDAGFKHASTTTPGIVDRSSDPFRFPRVQINDMDGESFSRLILDWLERD